jgi:metallo-beta-lactamase family protein
MAKLSFYGATGIVTGSRYLLETQGKRLLIDCGLFQGVKEDRERNWEPFPVAPVDIDHVLLTHAHIDHSGFLPRLGRNGFGGKVYCTYATRDLCDVMLQDSAHLQEEDAEYANRKGFTRHTPALPLYTVEDAQKVLRQFAPVYYGEDLFLTDTMRIKFRDAGHILGSAMIDIKLNPDSGTQRILFSGDLGRPDQPILRNPVQVFNVDYLVVESTYGDRLHDGAAGSANDGTGTLDQLARVINETVQRNGVLVIPSFAVGRTQTLLFNIRELEEQQKIPVLPVYVDSPMAVQATQIFEQHKIDYDFQAKILELQGKKILQPRLLHVIREVEESKRLHDLKARAIIISASGMATGGRILHHLKNRLPQEKNTVLFIGYQAVGTRGRSILEGQPLVKIHGEEVAVKAKIENIPGYSAHADYNEILAWLMGFNRPPKKTFIVHGEPEASQALAQKIGQTLHWPTVIPKFGEEFQLE